MIKKDKSLNNYLKDLRRVSLQIAKLRLFRKSNGDFHFEEQKLEEKLKFLLMDKIQYEKIKKLRKNCYICNDTGYVGGRVCKCFKNMVKSKRFEFLNKNLPVKDFRFENFNLEFYSDEKIPGYNYSFRSNMKRILNYCFDYAKSFNEGSESLIMSGKTGLGKTHIAISIANVLLEKGKDVVYFSVPGLLEKLESKRFSNDGTLNRENINLCDCLILDDFGEESLTNFGMSVIYDVLNNRTTKGLPTIIITNLGASEIESKYSNKIVSRIIGNFVNIKFFGRDVRQKKLEKFRN